jgi:hypothetical protein
MKQAAKSRVYVLTVPMTSSLLYRYPELSLEFHPTKNAGLSPRTLSFASGKRVWWQCRANEKHVWQTTVANRTRLGRGCPFCCGQQADETNSLAALRPDLAIEWHPSKNQPLLPGEVTCGSRKKVWWRCARVSAHEWLTPIKDRTSLGYGCPFCACRGRVVSDENRLSVLYPAVAAEWHPTRNRMLWSYGDKGSWYKIQRLQLAPEEIPKKNRRLKPSDVSYGSNESVWWQCSKNKEHVWYCAISARTIDGKGCPLCDEEAVSLQNNYPGLVKLWHPSRNLPLEPAEVSYKSNQDAWWRCAKSADHVWQERVRKVVAIWEKGANPCPHCADRKTESISLQTLYPEVAKQWDVEKNLPLEPSKITYGSRTYVWWRCPKFPDDHFWRATVRNVVNCYKSGNTGCPFCSGRRKIESNH